MRKACGLLVVLVLSMLVGSFNVSVAEASVYIYIKADGTVAPPTVPIQRDGNTYTFTDNIYDVIQFGIEKSNIIIDGNGFTLQGTGSGDGFFLSERSNVTIQNTNVMDFYFGFNFLDSSNNTVFNNNITSNSYGVSLYDCYNNTFSNNNVMNNSKGIRLWRSPNNFLRNNTMAGNWYNFGVESIFSVSDFVQDVDESNTVDGKPIYYWIDAQDLKVPSNAGHVTLVNCCNITVEELELTKNIYGILLVNTTNSQIKGNNVTKNECGVMLYWSSNNMVSDNSITDNNGLRGVEIKESFNNTVSSNNMIDNLVGVRLSSSSNNTLSCNNIIDNGYGIYSVSGSDNRFYHNNFINNNPHVVPKQDFSNIWDNGCEGNYWSDYSGTDSDGDGIGDTPYNINPYNVDNFPLMNRYWNPADINHDLEVNLYDAVLVLAAYGSRQGDQNYNPHCDIAEPYGTINLYDAVSVLANYGKNIKND